MAIPRRQSGFLAASFAPPERPFAGDYAERHRAFLQAVLSDPVLLEPFAHGRQLPASYGVGLDERVVEYPWLFASRLRGRVLDAGSALNHEHVLDRLLPQIESLTIVTLEPEAVAFTERSISYVYDDLRDLPFRDGRFDTVVSLSTLEHVGMDNTSYSSRASVSDDPDAELALAVAELRRVLKPGGELLVSVPFGTFEDHRWFRQFGNRELDLLVKLLEPAELALEIFRYDADGWSRSDRRAAADASYRPPTASPAEDRAAAARAVACVRARPTARSAQPASAPRMRSR
jgi:SAM-dependent methyltransferase